MRNIKRVLGWTWAAPLTLFGLLVVYIFVALRHCTWVGRHDDVLVWHLVPATRNNFLINLLKKHSGIAVGNVVLLNVSPATIRGKIVLRHEAEHVRQAMYLGIFYPVLYFACWLLLHVCAYAHPVYDNPFEIDARRAAGQVIDVVSALKHAVVEGRLKLPTKHGG
jgi:hypothetical protein